MCILSHLVWYLFQNFNRIGGVMVGVLASSAVDRVFESRSGQTKYWLARNQNNVSEWSDMSTRGLVCQ